MKFSTAGISALLAIAPFFVGNACAADTPVLGEGSHGQQIVERAVAAHQDIASITVFTTVAGHTGEIAVASNAQRLGEAAPAVLRAVLKTGKAHFAPRKDHLDVALVLFDMQQKPAGGLVLSLRMKPGGSRAALESEARTIRDELARRISYGANLVQAAHMDPNVPMNSYAQHLVDQALIRHPDVLIMAIHATTPKNTDAEILASNIGRIGKKADEDDMRVVSGGETNLEVNKKLMRFEVELPLNDVSGVRLGALGVVFPYDAQTDQKARHAEAIRIRDEISRRILKPANLVESWPYDPKYSDDTYAQALVDKTLEAHRDIQVIGLHVTPPNGKANIILASNIGRIGKVADSDDMGVVNTGRPNMAVNAEGDRFETELALRDQNGTQIGAVSIVYGYTKGVDEVALAHKAQAVAAELAHNIPSAAALFGKPR